MRRGARDARAAAGRRRAGRARARRPVAVGHDRQRAARPGAPAPSARQAGPADRVGRLGRPGRPARRSSTRSPTAGSTTTCCGRRRRPDELFHQAVSGFLLEWAEAQRDAPHTIHVVGESWSGRAYELRDALERCAMPHAFCLADSDEGRALLAAGRRRTRAAADRAPQRHRPVEPEQRRDRARPRAPVNPERTEFDVVIVGAGPAGLSAAVYGASEGFSTLVVDEGGIGGQATLELADPQLPRLPARRQRRAAARAGVRAGLGLRRETSPSCSASPASSATDGRLAVDARRTRPGSAPRRDPRHRRHATAASACPRSRS